MSGSPETKDELMPLRRSARKSVTQKLEDSVLTPKKRKSITTPLKNVPETSSDDVGTPRRTRGALTPRKSIAGPLTPRRSLASSGTDGTPKKKDIGTPRKTITKETKKHTPKKSTVQEMSPVRDGLEGRTRSSKKSLVRETSPVNKSETNRRTPRKTCMKEANTNEIIHPKDGKAQVETILINTRVRQKNIGNLSVTHEDIKENVSECIKIPDDENSSIKLGKCPSPKQKLNKSVHFKIEVDELHCDSYVPEESLSPKLALSPQLVIKDCLKHFKEASPAESIICRKIVSPLGSDSEKQTSQIPVETPLDAELLYPYKCGYETSEVEGKVASKYEEIHQHKEKHTSQISIETLLDAALISPSKFLNSEDESSEVENKGASEYGGKHQHIGMTSPSDDTDLSLCERNGNISVERNKSPRRKLSYDCPKETYVSASSEFTDVTGEILNSTIHNNVHVGDKKCEADEKSKSGPSKVINELSLTISGKEETPSKKEINRDGKNNFDPTLHTHTSPGLLNGVQDNVQQKRETNINCVASLYDSVSGKNMQAEQNNYACKNADELSAVISEVPSHTLAADGVSSHIKEDNNATLPETSHTLSADADYSNINGDNNANVPLSETPHTLVFNDVSLQSNDGKNTDHPLTEISLTSADDSASSQNNDVYDANAPLSETFHTLDSDYSPSNEENKAYAAKAEISLILSVDSVSSHNNIDNANAPLSKTEHLTLSADCDSSHINEENNAPLPETSPTLADNSISSQTNVDNANAPLSKTEHLTLSADCDSSHINEENNAPLPETSPTLADNSISSQTNVDNANAPLSKTEHLTLSADCDSSHINEENNAPLPETSPTLGDNSISSQTNVDNANAPLSETSHTLDGDYSPSNKENHAYATKAKISLNLSVDSASSQNNDDYNANSSLLKTVLPLNLSADGYSSHIIEENNTPLPETSPTLADDSISSQINVDNANAPLSKTVRHLTLSADCDSSRINEENNVPLPETSTTLANDSISSQTNVDNANTPLPETSLSLADDSFPSQINVDNANTPLPETSLSLADDSFSSKKNVDNTNAPKSKTVQPPNLSADGDSSHINEGNNAPLPETYPTLPNGSISSQTNVDNATAPLPETSHTSVFNDVSSQSKDEKDTDYPLTEISLTLADGSTCSQNNDVNATLSETSHTLDVDHSPFNEGYATKAEISLTSSVDSVSLQSNDVYNANAPLTKTVRPRTSSAGGDSSHINEENNAPLPEISAVFTLADDSISSQSNVDNANNPLPESSHTLVFDYISLQSNDVKNTDYPLTEISLTLGDDSASLQTNDDNANASLSETFHILAASDEPSSINGNASLPDVSVSSQANGDNNINEPLAKTSFTLDGDIDSSKNKNANDPLPKTSRRAKSECSASSECEPYLSENISGDDIANPPSSESLTSNPTTDEPSHISGAKKQAPAKKKSKPSPLGKRSSEMYFDSVPPKCSKLSNRKCLLSSGKTSACKFLDLEAADGEESGLSTGDDSDETSDSNAYAEDAFELLDTIAKENNTCFVGTVEEFFNKSTTSSSDSDDNEWQPPIKKLLKSQGNFNLSCSSKGSLCVTEAGIFSVTTCPVANDKEITCEVPHGFTVNPYKSPSPSKHHVPKGFVVTNSERTSGFTMKSSLLNIPIKEKMSSKNSSLKRKLIKTPTKSIIETSGENDMACGLAVLPFSLEESDIKRAFSSVSINDIELLQFTSPVTALIKFSTKKALKKALTLYGQILHNGNPIYILETKALP